MNPKSFFVMAFVIGTSFLGGCAAPPAEDDGSSASAVEGDDVSAACTGAYSRAASTCNESSTDAAFDACLADAKADLRTCCKSSSSPECAADARDKKAEAEVSQACANAFSRKGLECGEIVDDAAATVCIQSAKDALKSCCAKGGSPLCAADAE